MIQPHWFLLSKKVDRMKYRGTLCAVTVAAVIALPANAEWNVQAFKDKMTDKPVKYAVLQAKAPESGVSAALEISCMADQRLFQLKLSSPLSRGQIGVNMRVDERKVMPRILNVFSDPYRIAFIAAPPFDLWGRKRFRVQLFPTGGPVLFYDFDLTGIDKAISAIACNKPPGATFEETTN